MKSHELAKRLLELPNYEIIMSRDSEGNGYSTIEDKIEYSSINVFDNDADLEDCGAVQPFIILYPYRERCELDEI